MTGPAGLLREWLLSDGTKKQEPWTFRGRYWSNSRTSNPSMVPMTSVLSSDILLKSSTSRWRSGLGVVGGVGGSWD